MRTVASSGRSVADVVAAAKPACFWLDDAAAPPPEPPLSGDVRADLAVVGAGFTGLWTALLAKQRDPGVEVVVLEAEQTGWAASGRNGGFCEASLTHGEENGRRLFPGSHARLEELGNENLEAIEHFVSTSGVDCGWERAGTITVATEPWHLAELRGEGQAPAGGAPRRGELPHLPGWRLGSGRGCPREPRPARVGAPCGLPGGGGAALRAEPRPQRSPFARWWWSGAAARRARDARRALSRRAGRARDERLPLAPRPCALPGGPRLRPRPRDRASHPGTTGRGGMAEPPGRRRRGEPIPLLPPHARRPDPVGRLRRRLPLRAEGHTRVRPARRHVPHPGDALLRDLPPVARALVHPPLGRCHRHVRPVLRVLRDRARWSRRLRGRIHGSRCRRLALRRAGHAGPALRAHDGAHRARDGPR